MKFSKSKRTLPIVKSKKPQFTKPVKLLNPDAHENKESLGL